MKPQADRLAQFITNASLPAYLKRELAEILAEVRKTEAAAPGMLEALRDLHRYITDRDWREELDERAIAATDGNVNAYEEVTDRASAAIAKAEGRAK